MLELKSLKNIVFTCVVFLLCSFHFACCQEKLPPISLKTIEGNLVDISNIDTKNVTVFSFWATWCNPCIKELDAINDEYENWQEETKVNIIAVSVDDSRTVSRVKPLINGMGWEYQVLLDTNQEFKRAVNATSLPFLIIVKDNIIQYTQSGYSPGNETELFDKIKQLAKNE